MQYNKIEDTMENNMFMSKVFEQLKISGYYLNRKAEAVFDSYHHLVPFTNGVYDLRDKCFRLPRENEFISVTVGYDYQETHFKDVDALIDSCMTDTETSKALKIYLGSILHATNKDEKVVFWVGSGGNGKSLIDTILRYTLGAFYMVLPASVYTNYEKDHNRASSVMAQLKNKRLTVCSETDETTKFMTPNFTRTSGGDAVSARHLRKDQEMFEPTHKSLIHTNYLPTFSSIEEALFRRIVVIWFRNLFKESHMIDPTNPYHKLRDDTLKTKVKSYDFRLQMMNLMIHYYAIYEREGFYHSQDILDANNAYRKDLEVVLSWARDNLLYTPGKMVATTEIYEAFIESPAAVDDYKFIKKIPFVKKLKGFKVDEKWYKGKKQGCVLDYVLKVGECNIIEEKDEIDG